MTKLEDIFKVGNSEQRRKALLEYAKALKINVLKAKKPDGDYNENELAVLIYDREQSQTTRKFENLGLFLAAVFFIGMVLGTIFLFVKMTQQP